LADEALSLEAVVLDRFSAPIRDLSRQLRALTDANRKSHVEGVGLAKAHGESFTRLRESVTKTADVFRKEFLPTLEHIAEQATGVRFAFMGIAGSTAAAIGAASAMSFAFAGTAYRLNALKTATGLSFNELRGLESLAPRIGVSVEQLDSGFESLAGHMERLRRNAPSEIAAMAATMFPNVRAEVAKLANQPREQQFEGILAIGERIKNQVGRGGGIANEKRFLEFFGLPPNFADFSKSELLKFYSVYREQNRDFSEKEQQAAIAAQTSWLDLRQKMQSFSDYVGNAFVPYLNTALKGVGDEFTSLSSGATAWFSTLVADPSISKSWDDLTTRVGADIKALIDGMSSFDDSSTRPRVLLPGMAPQWQSFGADIKSLITDADNVAKIVDDLNAKKVNWAEIMNLADLTDRVASFKTTWQPIVDWSDRMARLKWWLPGNQYEPPPSKDQPEGPTGPSVLDRLRSWLSGRSTGGPGRSPSGPAPAPFVLPKLGGMDDFSKPATAPVLQQFAPGYSPIAFHPENGLPNPLLDKSATSSSAGEAIAIIRKGVAGGLYDFFQTLRSMTKGGVGITPASYETGGGGSGDGAGGPGGGLGGTGSRGGGVGVGGPAAAIGRAVRRHGHGGGGSGGGQASGSELPPGTGGPLLDEISKAEGTRGYNDAFAHQHPGVDLSKMTINQVEALQRTQRGSPAIGRYQFMTKTLESLKKDLNLSGNEMFTPAMQERLARSLLQRRGYDQWKAGKLSDQAFMHNLSEEWAGLTDPYTGHGHYASIGQDTGHSLRQQFSALKAERDAKPATAVAGGPGRSPSGPATTSETLAKHGEALRKMFGERGPQKAPTIDRPSLPGQQDVSLRPGDLQRREPGSLLRAADQRQAAALKHEITGSASLHVKLASGLAPVSGVKTKGDLFREIRLDRAPLALANTTG
jgi:muramidase (phage lysozyme)